MALRSFQVRKKERKQARSFVVERSYRANVKSYDTDDSFLSDNTVAHSQSTSETADDGGLSDGWNSEHANEESEGDEPETATSDESDYAVEPPDTLCSTCSALDFSLLLKPKRYPSRIDLEGLGHEREICLPKPQIKSSDSDSCQLCSLVSKCAENSRVNPEDEKVQCAIRPILVWSIDRSSSPNVVEDEQVNEKSPILLDNHVSTYSFSSARSVPPVPFKPYSRPRTIKRTGKATLSGKWLVSFYEFKQNMKPLSPFKRLKPDTLDTDEPEERYRGWSQAGRSPRTQAGQRSSSHNPAAAASPLSDEGSVGRLLAGVSHQEPLRFTEMSVRSAVGSWNVEVSCNSLPLSFVPSTTSCRTPVPAKVDPRLLNSWLHDCCTLHYHPETTGDAKTRLASARASNQLRTINTYSGEIAILPENAKYVALSYVWGPAIRALFTSPWAAPRPSTIELPNTVRDGMSLASQLGYEWLWVDRLCIEQDNEDEKTALVPLIKDIFALAELTIVAAAGDDANVGLPGVSTPRSPEHSFTLRYADSEVKLLPVAQSFNVLLEDCKWRTRGWTFEEYVFSRRLLYVFPNEVVFSCAKGVFRETAGTNFHAGSAGSSWGDRGMTPPTIEGLLHTKLNGGDATADSPELTIRDFVRAAEEYSARRLTFEEDRIKAFAGLVLAASESMNKAEDQRLLVHGHPLEFFESVLTWQQEGNACLRRPSNSCSFAPSWSWASAGSKVYFLENGTEGTRNRMFEYTQLNEHDVLGTPIEKYIPPYLSRAVGSNSNKAFPSSEQWSRASKHDSWPGVFRKNETRMPRLILLTVVFESHVDIQDDGTCTLKPVEREDGAVFMNGRWWSKGSLAGYEPQPVATFSIDRQIQAPGGKAIFALVGGRLSLYVMLLRPHIEHGVLEGCNLSK